MNDYPDSQEESDSDELKPPSLPSLYMTINPMTQSNCAQGQAVIRAAPGDFC